MIASGIKLIERKLLPDVVVRMGMRFVLNNFLKEKNAQDLDLAQEEKSKFIQQLKGSPIALSTREANEQHYELPTEFFQLCLGKHLKYSSAYFKEEVEVLDQAEHDMLQITCERADLYNGQDVLEFGCGWGSLSLFMAEHFPKSRITSVSNSRTQKEFIDAQANVRGLKNLEIITADMNEFAINKKFDRIVSVEMFEHMRNWQALLKKAVSCCRADAKMFIHIFTHRDFAYLYDAHDPNDFIAKYFFTGGQMPSDDQMLHFQDDFIVDHHWRVNGMHYSKTAKHWLKNMYMHRTRVMEIFRDTYGDNAPQWWAYWKVFYMACAELWGYDNGNQWFVSHYLLRKRA